MGALPWFKFHSAAPTNIKVQALRRRVGSEADAYLYRLWAYCARDMPSGRFEGEAADGLEMAIGWHGEPGALIAALLAVRLLDRDGDALVVHDWAREQGAHVAKFLKDARRPHSKNRPPSSPEVPARELGDSREVPAQTPRGASPISTLSSSKGVQGETRPASHAAHGPSLVERLAATFKRKRSADYGLNAWGEPMPADLAGLQAALQQAKGDEAEVERRWEVGLDWEGWPTCGCFADLGRFWNRYAQAKPRAQANGKPVSRGFAGIEYREGVGNDFE